MNYYLIDKEFPDNKLRHYKNNRVASYTLEQLNVAAGYDKYAIITDETEVITVPVGNRMGFEVDPFAPADQVISRLS